MPEARKARAVGFNHVALEVGDIEEALAFYGRLFEFELRGKSKTSAFIDLGDQVPRAAEGPHPGRPTTAVISDSWSTTRTRYAARWRRRASSRCRARSSISATPGATG
jgi:Lactoylglutathione lyase and related lyases